MSPFTQANAGVVGQENPVEACFLSGSIAVELLLEWRGWCWCCRVAHRSNPLGVEGAGV